MSSEHESEIRYMRRLLKKANDPKMKDGATIVQIKDIVGGSAILTIQYPNGHVDNVTRPSGVVERFLLAQMVK